MDTAYELETKKLVKAWTIGVDTSYIMPENDIFIANHNEIENYDEVIKENKLEFIECRFRKGHIRKYENKETRVVPHFFIPNKEKLGVKTIPESPEHKKIKDFMYNTFFQNKELKLYYSKFNKNGEENIIEIALNELNIMWEKFSLKKFDFFEVGLIDTYNTKRADLFLKFDNFNSLFGHGLVIEVQLSSQTQERTRERTIDRALKGYSCIWIEKKHFKDIKDDKLELIDNIIIQPWQTILHNNAKYIEENIYNNIQQYSREIDLKFEKQKQELQKLVNERDRASGKLCPECNIGIIVVKENSHNKKKFLACTNYPKCRFTGGLE